ncbi:MAG TPA: hypothetical protein VMT53_22980 [Terriglobales bacterium]|nr:hypothetical protein [Terriglobales bacterium]
MPAETLTTPATVEGALREASKIPSIVTDAMEDGVRSASRAVRHGRYAIEDVIDEAQHTIKQRPFQAIGKVFVAGMLAGGFVTWLACRRH